MSKSHLHEIAKLQNPDTLGGVHVTVNRETADGCIASISAGRRGWVWPAPRWRGVKTDKTRSEKGCWHAIERAARDAGLEDVGWHTLRHTYASWLVMRAVPLRVVQQYLGHASIVQTETYAHLTPEFGASAVAVLDVPLLAAGPDKKELPP